MSLVALIRKRSTTVFATAIPAISATQQAETRETVATIAVASPTNEQTGILSTFRGADLPEQEYDARYFKWIIHFHDQEPMQVHCLPEPTHVEVLTHYPDAVAAEPLPKRTRPTATREQEMEVHVLVASVGAAYSFTHAEHQEALALALGDPDVALMSYRAMRNERNTSLMVVTGSDATDKGDRHGSKE